MSRRCSDGGLPPVGEVMLAAMNAIAADIHAEVDSFLGLTLASATSGPDAESVANRLQQILPRGSDEVPSKFVGGGRERRSLIAAYCLHKGTAMGSTGTSVTVRAYNQTANGMALADVTGDDMNGFARLSVREVRPRRSDAATRPADSTYLLLSGYMTGANGPLNRMRLYAYDGQKFRPLWMPEDIWGQFDVRVTTDGFTVEGEYYRDNRTRRDAYVVSESGVQLIPPHMR